MNRVIYDIETYLNIFSMSMLDVESEKILTYEVSSRHNDFEEMGGTLIDLSHEGYEMVGFNNLGFDYPVVHELLKLWKRNRKAPAELVLQVAREKADQIIKGAYENRFANIIWPKDQILPQIDLFKIHHFDNIARATSLKALEFAMRSWNVGDLPYDPDVPVPEEGFDAILDYNEHDVRETLKFYIETLPMMKLREELSEKFGKDFTNHNDTKIGKDIFVIKLEEALGPDICYNFIKGKGRKPRQTPRPQIDLGSVILDYVEFERPEFRAIHEWFKNQTIKQTKGVFSEVPFARCREFLWYADKTKKNGKLRNVNVVIGGRVITVKHGRGTKKKRVGGLPFVFGTGGLHACIDPSTWNADEDHVIIDVDVTSYYPSLAIVNRIFPRHLGEEFCDIYDDIKQERLSFAKDTPENAAYKLALNGVYGDSNNKYSPFFDPAYTMAITINGQLSLCMLAERAMEIRGLKILQVNTDGMTVWCPRKKVSEFQGVCREWEETTGLELEEARYSRMFIRDVNNYVAEYEDGKVKRKGKYEYNVKWHQNHSMLVVAKAAEAYLLKGTPIERFIRNHEDPFDFYMLAKCDRSSRIILRKGFRHEKLQRNNRIYASTDGGRIVKISPPLARKLTKKLQADFKRLKADFSQEELEQIDEALRTKQWFDIDALRETGYPDEQLAAFELCQPKDRVISLCDSPVVVHNQVGKLKNINYEFYINEARKLVEAVKEGYVIPDDEKEDGFREEP